MTEVMERQKVIKSQISLENIQAKSFPQGIE